MFERFFKKKQEATIARIIAEITAKDIVLQRRIEDLKGHMSMIDQGWTVYPLNWTKEQKDAAVEAYLHGGPVQWYPPGYREQILTEGKRQ